MPCSWRRRSSSGSQSLEQVGTASSFVDGHTQYSAWYELVPLGQVKLNITIHPGDKISGKVFKIRCKKCKGEVQCRYVGVLRRPGPTFLASCPHCGTEQHFRLSQWTGLATDADRS